MPKIIHYRSKCIGCNICFEMQAEMWRLSKMDGKATLINGLLKKGIYMKDIEAHELEVSLRTAAACPVKIIKVL
jgi:ferredoxin